MPSNLPKSGNIHLLASLAAFAFEAGGKALGAPAARAEYRKQLAEFQALRGYSDEFMQAWPVEQRYLAALGEPAFSSPLRTRLTTPERDSVYHICSRINGDLPLWETEDRSMLRRHLGLVAAYCGVEVWNYTILDNHFHLLVKVPQCSSRKSLNGAELLRRIGFLHEDLAVLLAEALVAENENAAKATAMGGAGSALRHFGVRLLRAGVGLASEAETARDWAGRELERHRGLMSEVGMFMRLLKQRFSKWYNATHGRYGTLWSDRFRSVLLQESEEAVQVVSAYIDLNAVRRGWVEDPAEYEFCGLGEATRQRAMPEDGLRRVLSLGRPQEVVGLSWLELAERHRSLLWGDIERANDTSSGGKPGKPRSFGELPVRQVSRPWVLAELLANKQPPLHLGAALGTREFVEMVMRSNRAAFGSDGTKRGDGLLLRLGITQRVRIWGLELLRNARLDSRGVQLVSNF
jgi:REP element-mobilizing transposase RayT